MQLLAGRNAFVTGGASGIGLAIAESLVEAGARVVLADWDEVALQREAERLGAAVFPQRLDVSDREGWQNAKQAAETAFGVVDLLVNNAGVGPDWSELVDMTPDHFDTLVAISLTGVFNGVHTFGAAMRARREGHIVNTASMSGLVPAARVGAYTAAKFAVVGLSEVLRAEMEPHGVGVSVLCPGSVRTNFVSGQVPVEPKFSGPNVAMSPHLVAKRVLEAIRLNELYVVTHPEHRRAVAERADQLLAAFDRAQTAAAI